jgi:hypothetical protein
MAIPIVRNPAVPITVPFAELQDSPVESLGENGFEATRTLVCAWTDRLLLAVQLSGDSAYSGGSVTYYSAAKYPKNPSATVQNIDIQPFGGRLTAEGGDLTLARYEAAQLTVRYSLPPDFGGMPGDDEVFVTESLEPNAEFLTLSPFWYFWSSDGSTLTDEEAPAKQLRSVDWIYERAKMPYIPQATFDLVGYCNKEAVISNSLGVTFAAETLLYKPPSLRRDRTFSGVGKWSIRYAFSYRPQGWNKFWRGSTSAFDEIINSVSAPVKVYPLGNFFDLIG